MIEVYPNLLVGSEEDYLNHLYRKPHDSPEQGYVAVLHACKEPYHREKLGYTTRGAPKHIGEGYYFIEDTLPNGVKELTLNIIDANEKKYIPDILFEQSFKFINKYINQGNILIHCNRGESRSTGITMGYMMLYTDFFEGCMSFPEVVTRFSTVYPRTRMANGMTECVRDIYNTWKTRKKQYS